MFCFVLFCFLAPLQVAKGSDSATEGSSHDSGMGSLEETVKAVTVKEAPPAVKPKPKSECFCEFIEYAVGFFFLKARLCSTFRQHRVGYMCLITFT